MITMIEIVLLIAIVFIFVLIIMNSYRRTSATNLVKTFQFDLENLDEPDVHNEIFDIQNDIFVSTVLLQIHTTQSDNKLTVVAEYNVKKNWITIILSILLFILIITLILIIFFKL